MVSFTTAPQKKKIALINIKDQDVMMDEKDEVEDVTLLHNFGDSIKIVYEGKIHFVKLRK